MKKVCVWFGIFSILLAFLILATCGGGSGGAPAPQAKQATYLQAVTAESVYVMAESDNTNPLTVEYGLTNSYGNSATTESTIPTTGGTYIHRIPLTGLTPETTYYYRRGSHSASFKTAVNSGTPFRFAWLADCRTGTAIHDSIASRILAAAPLFSLYGGDLCDDGASYSIYKEQFFRPNQLALAGSVPFFNTTGNHELWSTNTQAFMQAPASTSGNQGYYSFDYGDLHVVVMNYMDPGGYAAGSPQYNFIASDLAATTKPWKIVVCHSPAYVKGGHGEDANMIALTSNVFEPNDVNLVIAGHDHFYQRNLVNGIYHLIIGSAGADLSDPGPVGGYVQVSDKTYCWAIFDLTSTTLEIHVYDETGAAVDSLMLSK
jgi:Calcineurin-like phosphoesterase/Purple acid Phosphatase, N-terminal domain